MDMKIAPSSRNIYFCGNLDKYEERYKYIIPDLKEYIAKTGRISEDEIVNVAGSGGLSVVFDLKDGNVLKCSLENPLEYREHVPDLDIPFL